MIKQKRGQNKKAAIELSFNMIFSVFLIIVFIAVAVIAIMHFLNIGKTIQTGTFINDFQAFVDNVWNSAGSESSVFEALVNQKVQKVCFADLSKSAKGTKENKEIYNGLRRNGENNLYFYPRDSADPQSAYIKHLNITAIIKDENPSCFENTESIKIFVIKAHYEALVKVSRE